MASSGGATTLLLDTDVFSFLFKGDSRSALYAPLLVGSRLALSFITAAEIFQWAAMRHWGPKRLASVERELQQYAVIAVADMEMCRIWARVRQAQRAAGRPIASQDAWIAATALRYQLPLVTHNAADYMGITGLDLRTATP